MCMVQKIVVTVNMMKLKNIDSVFMIGIEKTYFKHN